LQGQFGDRPLFLGKRAEHVGEMLLTGTQALRLGALGQLRRWGEVWPVLALATRPLLTPRRLGIATWSVPIATVAPAAAITTGAISVAVVAATTIVPVAPFVAVAALPWAARIAAIMRRPLLDDWLEVAARKQFEQVAAPGLLLRRNDRQDADALDVLFALGTQLIADSCPTGQDRSVEDAFGLASTGGAPRPRAIVADRRQFDVDPRRHGSPRYPLAVPLFQNGPMPIYALGDQLPTIDDLAYVHPDAVIIGSVTIGPRSSIWPNAVLRGDDGEIRIGAGSSVQDCSVLHTTPIDPTVVGDDCVIGHLVHLEGCTIEDRALVGNGSIVLHRAIVRTGAIVAANAVVLNDTEVPSGALAVGIPATIKPGRARPSDIAHSAQSYVDRAVRFGAQLRRID
jgi:carbonic anhydrase/acetyltransferase-like protein (isoleucine patch superfamily)